MPTLTLDILTAAVAADILKAQDNTIEMFAQAIDEDWKRYSCDPAYGGRHLVSTRRNRNELPPTGLTYLSTQLIQPGPVRAEDRPIAERFLQGVPDLAGEVLGIDGNYVIETVLLVVGGTYASFDRKRCVASFLVIGHTLPNTLLAAAIGRTLGDVMDVPHGRDMRITGARHGERKEMLDITGLFPDEGVIIETAMPTETASIEFESMFTDGPKWR